MSENTRPASIIVDDAFAQAEQGSGDLLGKQVGGYRVVRQLGSGGMGAVYEAQNDHGSRVAIKVLHREVAADPVLRAQFERETRIISKLDNVHIVRGFGYEVLPDGRPCLLMMFHENTSLDAVMAKSGGQLSVRDALAFGYQILGGLKAAHGAHVVHRDLKPSNVLTLKERLQVDGVNVPLVKLVDFGLAFDASPRSKRLSRPLSKPLDGGGEQIRAGTPAYISPEHALDQPTDARSDLYAFGVMLFEMLSGELPFEGSDVALMQKHISDIPPLVSTRVNGLPEGLAQYVARLLEKNPADRFQSADEAQRELLVFLRRVQGDQTSIGRSNPSFDTAQLPKSAPQATQVLPDRQVRAGQRQRSMVPVFIGGGVVAVVLVVGVVMAFRGTPADGAVADPVVLMPSVPPSVPAGEKANPAPGPEAALPPVAVEAVAPVVPSPQPEKQQPAMPVSAPAVKPAVVKSAPVKTEPAPEPAKVEGPAAVKPPPEVVAPPSAELLESKKALRALIERHKNDAALADVVAKARGAVAGTDVARIDAAYTELCTRGGDSNCE